MAKLKGKSGKDPIVLGSGRPLFAGNNREIKMKLTSAKAMDRGATLLTYREGD